MKKREKRAFTLAEVLITLGIIGVVAALTIPTLVQNYQTKSWATASKVFEAKFTEALKTMNVQGQLGNYGKYDSTEGFVEELQKHFKITNVCDRDHLMQCFEKTVTWGDKDADLSNIKESKDFVQLAEGEADWGTNVMGIQFANGVTGLIAYNPKCKSNPHNNQVTGSDCYALLYDTSGFANPNELGKDLISTANVKNLAGGGCVVEVNGVCVTQLAFQPTSITQAECEANKGAWGIQDCTRNGYWLGSVMQCGGVSKMASLEQLAAIANYIYGTTDIGANTDKYDVTREDSKAIELGFSNPTISVWSNEAHKRRTFYTTRSEYYDFTYNYAEHQAICVE